MMATTQQLKVWRMGTNIHAVTCRGRWVLVASADRDGGSSAVGGVGEYTAGDGFDLFDGEHRCGVVVHGSAQQSSHQR